MRKFRWLKIVTLVWVMAFVGVSYSYAECVATKTFFELSGGHVWLTTMCDPGLGDWYVSSTVLIY